MTDAAHPGTNGTSKLRLPTSPGELRLLKGYGPLAALLVAFALMAVFVPSVAPQQTTVTKTRAVGGSGTGTGANGKGGTGGAGSTAGGTAGSGGAGGTSGSSTGGSSGQVAGGTSTPCPGKTLQVTGDPYSPPCIAFTGNNGGATSQGVTANTITVTYRQTSDPGFQQTLAQIGGAQFLDSPADVIRTVQGLATYFNKNFQLYGRQIKVVPFNGQGSQTAELLGQGQQQADADAITAGQQYHAFAELNGSTEPYDVALAQQHVISFGAPYLSASFMAQYDPYMWSIATEGNDVVAAAAQAAIVQLAGKPAAYAGGSLRNQPRKIAIIAPDNPWYQSSANVAVQMFAAAGHPVADDIQYQLNLGTLSSQAATIDAKLQNDGITTVVCGCDPVMPVYLTSRAHEQGYTPEWNVAGVALTDNDIVGQLFDQSEWSHAFGISFQGPTLPKNQTLGYAAYESVESDQPANIVDLIYAQMYQMVIGIQMAGPNLTPQTFEQGERAYPGSVAGAPNAEFGTWLMPPGHYSPQVDFQEIYWDPTKTSAYNGKQGAYVDMGPRYKFGTVPPGNPPLPAGFGSGN
jgi:hypothetical protein